MFSMFKKSSEKEEVVLPELNEGQLSQVAGGMDNWQDSASSSDNWNQWQMPHHHHHHHHRHHHHKQMWMAASSSNMNGWNNGNGWDQQMKW